MTALPVRNTDPDSSHAAARSLNLTRLEALVFNNLESAGPATTEELAQRMNMRLVTVSPRLRPLEEKGRVVRNGSRLNPSGRKAIIWRANP
jgi:predicted transcriptional regulator